MNYEMSASVQACFIGLQVALWLNEVATWETRNETILAVCSLVVQQCIKLGKTLNTTNLLNTLYTFLAV